MIKKVVGQQPSKMQLCSLVLLLAITICFGQQPASPPPPPPDRIWFRQDQLDQGQTCQSEYNRIKVLNILSPLVFNMIQYVQRQDSGDVITGKGPIILPESATFSICIKFLEGVYTDFQTGEAVKRSGRDWTLDSGTKGPCAEGCCEYQYSPRENKHSGWFLSNSDCSQPPSQTNQAHLFFKSTVKTN